MSGAVRRVFVARLAGLPVFDPLGDQVGKVRDVVTVFHPGRQAPRAVGLVVEVPGRRRVFVPMTRVTTIDAGHVITTGLVNMRRFEQRPTETLLLAEMLDRVVHLRATPGSGQAGEEAVIEDIAIEQPGSRDWRISKVAVRVGSQARRGGLTGRLTRRGETRVVDFEDLTGVGVVEQRQGAANLLAAFEGLKAADLADVIRELTPKRRLEVASALDDERLADVLEEMPEDDQVEILSELGRDRAADVLEAMEPDDAADLLSELPSDQAEQLLDLMDPEEADDVRRLLAYGEDTAGGIMTTEPVILAPDATVAEALAHVRRQDVIPALAAAVFVCRAPLEAPTGKYLGLVHLQRMLRESPGRPIGSLIDKSVEPLAAADPLAVVTRRLATYNLVSMPVTDPVGRLLGAVTVDDVLDHLLPEDWRETDERDGDLAEGGSAHAAVIARAAARDAVRGGRGGRKGASR